LGLQLGTLFWIQSTAVTHSSPTITLPARQVHHHCPGPMCGTGVSKTGTSCTGTGCTICAATTATSMCRHVSTQWVTAAFAATGWCRSPYGCSYVGSHCYSGVYLNLRCATVDNSISFTYKHLIIMSADRTRWTQNLRRQ
jgi:hypothetical protein